MLHKYGMRDFVGALPQAEETLKRVYKIVEVVKDWETNGKPAKTFKLIRGSSQYDSKEMSDFIKGVVEEAKLLGIETMTPDELAEMNARWTPWNKHVNQIANADRYIVEAHATTGPYTNTNETSRIKNESCF